MLLLGSGFLLDRLVLPLLLYHWRVIDVNILPATKLVPALCHASPCTVVAAGRRFPISHGDAHRVRGRRRVTNSSDFSSYDFNTAIVEDNNRINLSYGLI